MKFQFATRISYKKDDHLFYLSFKFLRKHEAPLKAKEMFGRDI